MSLDTLAKKLIKIFSVQHVLARRKPKIYRTFTVFEISIVKEKKLRQDQFR